MPAVGLAILTILTCAILIVASPRTALGVVLVVTFFVPDTILFPWGGSSHVTVFLVTLLAFCVGLGRKMRREGSARKVLRLTSAHWGLYVFVAVAFVVGVILAGPDVKLSGSFAEWQRLAQQFVFFTAVLVAVRMIGDPVAASRIVAGVVVAAAILGIVEHFTDWSYARWFFQGRSGGVLDFPLEMRGGDVRVRGASQFAVAYGWTLTILFPLVFAVAARSRRIVAAAGPLLVAAAITWTYSRSAYVGVPVSLAVLVLAGRFDRRIARLAGVAGAAVLVLVFMSPLVSRTFGSPDAPSSTQVRAEQVPLVFRAAADRPLIGVGLGGLELQRGIQNTDTTFLVSYGEQGVIGLCALGLLFGVAIATVAPGLSSTSTEERRVGAAAFAGVAITLGAAASLALFSVPSAARAVWVLVALGTSVAQRARRPNPLQLRRVAWRIALPLVGVVLGLAGPRMTTPDGAVAYRFQTIGAASEAIVPDTNEFIGDFLITTGCGIIADVATRMEGVTADCFNLGLKTGVGFVRIEAPTLSRARDAAEVSLGAARQAIRGFVPLLENVDPEARDAAVRTAPVWMGAAGLILAVLLPRRRSPEHRDTAPASMAAASAL